jgi:hypothetical protein
VKRGELFGVGRLKANAEPTDGLRHKQLRDESGEADEMQEGDE